MCSWLPNRSATKKGHEMKKVQTRFSFWDWLMGHGQANAGAGG